MESSGNGAQPSTYRTRLYPIFLHQARPGRACQGPWTLLTNVAGHPSPATISLTQSCSGDRADSAVGGWANFGRNKQEKKSTMQRPSVWCTGDKRQKEKNLDPDTWLSNNEITVPIIVDVP